MATITKREGKRGAAWQAKVRARGRNVSATFDSKAEAAAWAARTEAAIRAGEALPGEAPPGDRFFVDAAEEYLRGLAGLRRERTLYMYGHCVRRLGEAFGGRTLAGITRADAALYRDARLAVVGPASVRHDLTFLRLLYRHARLVWGLDVACPVDDLPLPAPPKNREPLLTLAEIERLLDWCCVSESPLLYSYVSLMLQTAMRPGEAAALRWDQARLAERVIVLTQTKTGRSRRVPLTRSAVELLARMPRSGERVFVPDSLNRPVLSNYFRRAFGTACARAGLSGITLYSLRHVAASYLVMRGADIRTVAEIMGHANIATTMRYTHLLDAHKLAAVDRLEGLGG